MPVIAGGLTLSKAFNQAFVLLEQDPMMTRVALGHRILNCREIEDRVLAPMERLVAMPH